MRSGLKTLLEPEPAAEDGDGAPSPLVYGAAGLTAAALAGGAALLMRRRVRRSLDEPPIPPAPKPKPAPGDDFAGAELARVLTHRLHGGEVEPAVVVAEQARRFLAEEAVDEAAVVFAYQGRNAVTLLLRASLAEQPRLLELATPFGTRLGSDAQATVTAERDVVWRLTGLKIAGLLTPGADRPADPLALLAVGVAPSRETVYANWRALGHVLVAGLPGGGTDVVLTTLVAALAARRRPDELRLSMIASRGRCRGNSSTCRINAATPSTRRMTRGFARSSPASVRNWSAACAPPRPTARPAGNRARTSRSWCSSSASWAPWRSTARRSS